MPYQYFGQNKVFKSDEDREEIRPSGLRIVQSVYRARRSLVNEALEVARKGQDGLELFGNPSITFSDGFCAVSATYYGISEKLSNTPYIELGREEGFISFRLRIAVPRAIVAGGPVGSPTATRPFYFFTDCPTRRYTYAKRFNSPYLKHSHPTVVKSDFNLPTSDERYISIRYGVLESSWFRTNLEEQNYGSFSEVIETFKFGNYSGSYPEVIQTLGP